jgi:hypothetical protein
MSDQRKERRGEGELDTEHKKHIEQPGRKDQEQSSLQPELQQEPEPEEEEGELEDEAGGDQQEEEQNEERLDQQA